MNVVKKLKKTMSVLEENGTKKGGNLMDEITRVYLLKEDIKKKIKLALVAGYEIIEIIPNKKYCIKDGDSWCNNVFTSPDEILKLIQPDLYKFKFKVVAA
jgi:hypothetical protein